MKKLNPFSHDTLHTMRGSSSWKGFVLYCETLRAGTECVYIATDVDVHVRVLQDGMVMIWNERSPFWKDDALRVDCLTLD